MANFKILRYFLAFSYKGTNYHGWQRQPNATSVQEMLEKCLLQLLDKEITINGSSRTDTGVHAKVQFAHFDTTEIDIGNLVYRMNSWLPKDIAVKEIYQVSDERHSRFDATSRAYCYRINQEKDVFNFETSLFYNKELDFDKMNRAASLLLKHNDFQCFSKVKTEVNNYKCDITRAEWLKNAAHWEFHIEANRFLRGMVRAIVGTLFELGQGKMELDEFQMVLESKDRNKAGANVKAHGLTLEKVNYPEAYFNV